METSQKSTKERLFQAISKSIDPSRVIRGKDCVKHYAGIPPPLLGCMPESPQEIAAVLKISRVEKMPVVVLGAGSRLGQRLSVRLSGTDYLVLGTDRLCGVERIQPDSLWVSVRSGTSLRQLMRLTEQVGCVPAGVDNGDGGTVGGWVSTHAKIPDPILGVLQPSVLAVEAVLATGRVVRSVQAPRAATGPDWFSLFMATWGGFGVITKATLKLQPVAETRRLVGFRFSKLDPGIEWLKWTARRVIMPSESVAVVDVDALRKVTRVGLVYGGDQDTVHSETQVSSRQAEGFSGRQVDELEVEEWIKEGHRLSQPVFECSVRWSALAGLLKSITRQAQKPGRLVLDKPDPTGCRARLGWSHAQQATLKPGALAESIPRVIARARKSQASSLAFSRDMMERIRDQIDPEGLLNPQAWPLAWPEQWG